ncbi:hypothetical protein E2C01_086508 [Portunus trituberculatus]|uniref:Uncharacterized protein n=1 Tax=Portunus trituberculatus TaxID=210409 RepID=A0A5B7JES1_PORTR|nr:hypothetical protein [Portunus trituberculatus]
MPHKLSSPPRQYLTLSNALVPPLLTTKAPSGTAQCKEVTPPGAAELQDTTGFLKCRVPQSPRWSGTQRPQPPISSGASTSISHRGHFTG